MRFQNHGGTPGAGWLCDCRCRSPNPVSDTRPGNGASSIHMQYIRSQLQNQFHIFQRARLSLCYILKRQHRMWQTLAPDVAQNSEYILEQGSWKEQDDRRCSWCFSKHTLQYMCVPRAARDWVLGTLSYRRHFLFAKACMLPLLILY